VHAENKYNSGITSLNERLDSYEDLLNAQNAYLQSLASYTLAKYKLNIRQIDLKSNN
jgi:outer membrane protein